MKDSTIRRLQRERRDQLFKLLRLARRLHLAPYSGPNAVKPVTPDDWDRAAGSLAPVNAKHSNLSVKFELWYSYVQLLRQLREGEFVSCYRPGNFKTVCLTVLDFSSIFVATRLLERVAPQLLPNGCAEVVRLRTKKKKRRENHPRFRRWMGKLPAYLDELEEKWGNEPETPVVSAKGGATKAELKKLCQQQPGGQKHWVFSGNGSGVSVKDFATYHAQVLAEKKKTAKKKAVVAKRSGAKPVARAKATRPSRRKKVA